MKNYFKIENDLLAKIKETESKRQVVWDKKRDTEDYSLKNELQEEAWDLSSQITKLKEEAEKLKNITACLSNGGELIDFTDKKGFEHKEVCDFRGVSTDDFDFSEEDILDKPHPKYIPFFDERTLERRAFMVDAIKYAKDSYIVPIKGFSEKTIQNGSLQLVILNLDQLVLTLDYYHVKAIAKNKKEAREKNERNEKYFLDKPRDYRERFYNQKGFYRSLPAKLKKKIGEEEWNDLPLEEKQELYIPVKRYSGKRITSKLSSNEMYVSFADLYLRFVDSTKTVDNFVDEKIKEAKEKGNSYSVYEKIKHDHNKGYSKTAHPDIFNYYFEFRDAIKYKLIDIKVQRNVLSETYQKGIETSYGKSGTDDRLYKEFGILVKRQNGEKISIMDFDELKEGWEDVQSVFGNLKPLSEKYNIVVSHASKKYQFINKRAIGVFIPSMHAIGVSGKYGATQFKTVMAHEVAHFLDYCVGQIQGLRYSTDDFESTSGSIVSNFRDNMNMPIDAMTDYIKSSKECFARAFEQYFAWKKFGVEAKVEYSEGRSEHDLYFKHPNYVSESKWGLIYPLIEKFLEENKDVLNFTVDLDQSDEKQPIGVEEEIEFWIQKEENEKIKKGLEIIKTNKMAKDLTKKDIEYLEAVMGSDMIPEKWKIKASELVDNAPSEISEAEAEVYVTFRNKDKGFATDKKYFKSYEDAEKWARKEFEKFDPDFISYVEKKQTPKTKEKPSSEKQQLEEALKGINVAIDLAGETEELKKAKKGIEVALSLI